MFRKIKLRFFAIGLAAIVMSLLTQGSLAYYTIVGTATNVVTSGNITMQINEMTDQGTPFPEEGVYIIPGDIVSKVVTVENICNHPFYLRVKMVYGIDNQVLPYEDCFKLNINTEHWTYHDGWYYYNGIVEPGQESPYIFSNVEIVGSKVDNSYIGSTLNLTVNAQAVQTENNPLPVEGDYTSVVGWPAEVEGE